MVDRPVLFLARGGEIDGQQRQVLYLAKGLAAQGARITAAVDGPGKLHDELVKSGVESHVCRMSSWRSIARIVDKHIDAAQLTRLARHGGAHIVHAHDVWRAEYARTIAAGLSIPYVVHVRGPLSERDIKKHRLDRAHGVISIAQRYVDDLVQGGIDPKRITLIDDAVDLELFASSQVDPTYLRTAFGVQAPLLVGMVGQLSAYRRIREFLDIVQRLPSSLRCSTQFVIAGEWADDDYRRQVEIGVARLELSDCVRFIGRCDSDLVPRLLSSLDVLVTLSGGSVMFEAMAMGKPVLSIRSDGRHSQHTRHGDTAWCVDGDDGNAAAQALAHLLTQEGLRQRLGDTAREWVRQNLSTTVMVAKVGRLYGELLE